MKLKLFGIFVLFSLVAWFPLKVSAQEDSSSGFTFVIKGGFDFMGEGDLEIDDYGYSESSDIDNGFSAGAEIYYGLGPVLAGAGVAYMFPRKIEDSDGSIKFIPVYAVLNIPFAQGGVTPYITGQVGYNFFYIDSKLEDELDALVGDECLYLEEGGLYWAIGGGIILENNIMFEIIYSSSSAELSITPTLGDEVWLDLTYTKVTASVGYRF